MKYLITIISFLIFSFSSFAGIMSELDLQTRQSVKEYFLSESDEVVQEIKNLWLEDVKENSQIDLVVHSVAIAPFVFFDDAIFNCTTEFKRVSARLFKVVKTDCELSENW
ncbi:MAG: hypothetical protein HON90_10660 [Halobacteriovoraceae bacterium]|jgi:hypothetical protein|nr:hypothetical protein [Halobacteriovoraceae bacterium]